MPTLELLSRIPGNTEFWKQFPHVNLMFVKVYETLIQGERIRGKFLQRSLALKEGELV